MTIQEQARKTVARFVIVALTIMQVAFLPVGGGSFVYAQKGDDDGVMTQIYDNGTLASGATALNGAAAPAGTQWSEAQRDFAVTNYANTLAGVGCQQIGTTTNNRCADDFNVPVGQTWTINEVIVFAYQTGFAGGTSPFTSANLRIWSGRPGDPGSTIVFGDTTTNRLGASTDSTFFRIFSSVVGSGANPPSTPGTTRRVWQNTLTVSPGLALAAGNYWIDFQLNAGAGGNFAPNNTIVGTRFAPFWNGRQSIGGTGGQDVVDVGQTPTGNPPPVQLAQDFPFKLRGSTTEGASIPRSRTIDFDGDNKTDLAVARAANAAAQTTWLLMNSGGTTAGITWGTGVGFSGGDVAIPADYDGDGRTDVAVWRPGAAGTAATYVLKSNGNVVDVDVFGQTGDDPTVVGDYDGDGKADLAVYRSATQSHFWYQRSTVGGNGCTSPGACNDISWGSTGDKPYPGDFDGDGRHDFSVVRNSGGAALHFQLLSAAGYRALPYGLFTDRFLTGDFDADNRTDFAALRVNGANLDWYVTTSGNGQLFLLTFGAAATDLAIPGDYDGDRKTDVTIWRSGTGGAGVDVWWRKSFASPLLANWGSSAVALIPPDYPVTTSVNVH